MVKRKGIFRTTMEMAAHSSMVVVLEAVPPWGQQGSQGGTGYRGYTVGSQSRQCLHTVPDTSYLCGSEVFHSFSAQVSVKVREDICSATAPIPRTNRVDSVEGFAAGLCTSDCVDSR